MNAIGAPPRSARRLTARRISASVTGCEKCRKIRASGGTSRAPSSGCTCVSRTRGVDSSNTNGAASAVPSIARVPAGISTR